jgi:hypothetical protein
MSKKNLLNESQIRKFMKYANIAPLADKFINEVYHDLDEDEHMEEGRHDKMGEGRHEDMEEGRGEMREEEMMEMGGMREDEHMEEGEHMMEGEHEAEVAESIVAIVLKGS